MFFMAWKKISRNEYVYFRRGHINAEFLAFDSMLNLRIPQEVIGKKIKLKIEIEVL